MKTRGVVDDVSNNLLRSERSKRFYIFLLIKWKKAYVEGLFSQMLLHQNMAWRYSVDTVENLNSF